MLCKCFSCHSDPANIYFRHPDPTVILILERIWKYIFACMTPATLFEIFQKSGRRAGSKWQKGLFEKTTNKPFLSFWLGKYIFSSSWPNSNTYLGKDLKIYMSDRRTQPFLRFFPRRADKSGQNDKKSCMNPREKPVAGLPGITGRRLTRKNQARAFPSFSFLFPFPIIFY